MSSPNSAEAETQLRQSCAELKRRLHDGDACRAEEFFAVFPHLFTQNGFRT